MTHMNQKMREYGIKPIWVFDGKPSELKSKENMRRREMRKMNQERKQTSIENEDMVSALKYSKRAIFLTKDEVESAKNLLYFSGVEYLESSQEADPLLVYLKKEGIVDEVLSSDTDLLVYGVDSVLKRSVHDKSFDFESVSLDIILEALGFDYDQFVDYCILIGNDYNSNAPKLGAVRGYNIIKEISSLDNIFSSKYAKMYEMSSYEKFQEVRQLYKSVQNEEFKPLIVDSKEVKNEETEGEENKAKRVKRKKGDFNPEGLKEFYLSKDFSEVKIESIVYKMQKVLEV